MRRAAEDLEHAVAGELGMAGEDSLQNRLVGQLAVRHHEQPPARLQRLARRLDHAGADFRLGRPAAMKGRVHDDGVVAPLDRLAQQIDPEEARLEACLADIALGRLKRVEIRFVKVEPCYAR